MPKAKLNGIDIYYEVYGSGEPLLLITGLGGSIIDWLYQIPPLSRHFQVIAIENRGAGRTEKPEEHSIELYAQDCVALLDHLSIPSANVFGISMGGMIGQQMALDHRERVRSLILAATDACPAAWPPVPSVNESVMRASVATSLREVFDETAWIGYSADFLAEHKDDLWLLAQLRQPLMPPPDQWQKQLGAVMGFDVRERVDQIDAPTLVLHGDADVVVPLAGGAYLAERIKGARMITIPGTGHYFVIEAADRTNQAVIDFLTR